MTKKLITTDTATAKRLVDQARSLVLPQGGPQHSFDDVPEINQLAKASHDIIYYGEPREVIVEIVKLVGGTTPQPTGEEYKALYATPQNLPAGTLGMLVAVNHQLPLWIPFGPCTGFYGGGGQTGACDACTGSIPSAFTVTFPQPILGMCPGCSVFQGSFRLEHAPTQTQNCRWAATGGLIAGPFGAGCLADGYLIELTLSMISSTTIRLMVIVYTTYQGQLDIQARYTTFFAGPVDCLNDIGQRTLTTSDTGLCEWDDVPITVAPA